MTCKLATSTRWPSDLRVANPVNVPPTLLVTWIPLSTGL